MLTGLKLWDEKIWIESIFMFDFNENVTDSHNDQRD